MKISSVLRPEYVFNPPQLLRRLSQAVRPAKGRSKASTPWGVELSFHSAELHGRAMLTLGLSDLRVLEAISRIVAPGDTAVDVGANIGIMSSLMALRAGNNGMVHALEPHPSTYNLLEENVSKWRRAAPGVAQVNTLNIALSNLAGCVRLVEPSGFGMNSGLARIAAEGDAGAGMTVNCGTFDGLFGDAASIKLVKIDVEGHEDSVLEGMRESLREGRIEAVIFEEHRQLPSQACNFISQFGYKSFLLDRTFWSLRLVSVDDAPGSLSGEATNVLSLRDKSALSLFSGGGWTCLGGSAASR